jgi:hypothetical protein|nr:hypothetical protein [Candidatus Kapabacteria bacterium]
VTNGKVKIEVSNAPTFAQIDEALKRNRPIIVKIKLWGSVVHWVLIVGKSGKEYLVKDPLGDGEDLELLSDIADKFYSIRIVRK